MRLPGPTNEELINNAAGVINPKMVGDRLFGDVGCALLSRSGNLYLGVCIDTASGTGFCAEHSAIAAMVTAGEYSIAKIVAVWKDDNGGAYALPPCGRCREFLRQVDEDNLDTDVILGKDKVSKLKDLLPSHEWPEPLAWSPHRRRRATSGWESGGRRCDGKSRERRNRPRPDPVMVDHRRR